MARAAAAVVTVVDVKPIVGVLARWWNKSIRHLGRHQITPPVYINFCYWTAAMVLMWGDFSRAQEDEGRADDPTTVTTAEDDGGGVDEKEEASSTAGSDNARLAKAMEHWFLVGLGGLLVLALLGCCMLNIYHESSKLQKHRRSKNLAALRSNEETRNWSSTLEARKRQFGFILTNGASDGVQHHQRDKYFVEAFDYPRIISGVHLSSDIDDLSIVERSLSLTSVASRGGSGYDLGGNSSSSNNNSNNNSKKKKTSTMRSHSGGAFNYPRFTTGVHPGSGINDLSIVERSMSLSSVAQRGGSAYGFGSFSSSNNRNKSINTVGLGPNLSHTIFEGDELQGKKAPGEKGYVYRNPLARQHAGSEGVLGTPRRHVAL